MAFPYSTLLTMNAETILSSILQNPIQILLIVLVVIAIAQNIILSFRLHSFLKGSNGKSLEGAITALGERTVRLETHAKTTSATLTDTDRRLKRSVQGVSVKRFDPFQNAGGQQSFATAFLNEEGSGVVVSGIHARDGVRVYAKEVTNFKSERELSDEERGAIETAQKSL